MIKIKGTDKYLSLTDNIDNVCYLMIVNKNNISVECLFYINDALNLWRYMNDEYNFDLYQHNSLKIVGIDNYD
jgi:hypothetical protein